MQASSTVRTLGSKLCEAQMEPSGITLAAFANLLLRV